MDDFKYIGLKFEKQKTNSAPIHNTRNIDIRNYFSVVTPSNDPQRQKLFCVKLDNRQGNLICVPRIIEQLPPDDLEKRQVT